MADNEIKKPFLYKEMPELKEPFLCSDIDLQEMFDKVSSEMALQQNKRDQIIAFYLTMLGLTSTLIFTNTIAPLIRAAVLGVLFLIGCFWSTVILRYRIYKEAYWIACRTITCLYTHDRAKISQELIKHIFYKCMKKNFEAFAIDKNDDKKASFKTWKLIKSNITSAEYLMFTTLVFLTSLGGGMTIAMVMTALSLPTAIICIAFAVFVVIFVSYMTYRYAKALENFYAVLSDGLQSSFRRAYKKAWQLHMFE